MDARRRWSQLSERQRRGLLVGAALEGVLKIVALRDLRKRPAASVRGPKWAWGAVVILVNAMGTAPIAYLLFGRRSEP
jgi:hypothetical protein